MGIVVGKVDVETALFDVIKREEAYEIRTYHRCVMASTDSNDCAIRVRMRPSMADICGE